jgi:uncharacterized NAD(P)/FAD-binding protein YdhS
MTAPRVAVVGGGASGVVAAIQLVRAARAGLPLEIVVYDASDVPGRGVAYGTTDRVHLLNVPAARMSALDGDAEHFLRWLRSHDRDADAEDYRPRAEYAGYLADALAEHAVGARVRLVRSEVVDLRRTPSGFLVSHRTPHEDLVDDADAVVLAIGSPAPDPLAVDGVPLPDHDGHVENPWAAGAIDDLVERLGPDGSALLVGTGLTAVDLALSIEERCGPGVRVLALSRHGLLPRAQVVPRPQPWPLTPPSGDSPLTLAAVEEWVRAGVYAAAEAGVDWRAVVDGVRPHVATIWRRLPVGQRRQFLSGPCRVWEVHRHRMAPQVAARIDAMRASGRLRVLAGRLRRAVPSGTGWSVTVGVDGSEIDLGPAAVVNCTGPSTDPERCRGGLVAAMLARGLARPDVLGLGLDVTGAGEVRDRYGAADPQLRCVGPLRRGEAWESTAIPEIRGQAAAVAADLHRLLTPVIDRAPIPLERDAYPAASPPLLG